MKTGTAAHPKFMRLMQESGLSRPLCVGLLELTWHFAYEYSPSGDIGKWDDALIEENVGWTGERGVWISTLCATGWLCASKEHRLVIHDWPDHIPEFIKKRHQRRGLTMAADTCRTDGGQTADTRQTNGTPADVYPTQPNPTEPNRSTEVPPAADARTTAKNTNGKGSRGPKVYKPERFEGEPRQRILDWAKRKGFNGRVIAEAFERWDSWGTDDLRTIPGWEASFKGIVRTAIDRGEILIESHAEKLDREAAAFRESLSKDQEDRPDA